ncbi:MAG: hypothetical protein QOG89_1308, partial [Thermomicrobiales bacterium]|nr:hypothetical protein [Thermomicrobiales bacterium]
EEEGVKEAGQADEAGGGGDPAGAKMGVRTPKLLYHRGCSPENFVQYS